MLYDDIITLVDFLVIRMSRLFYCLSFILSFSCLSWASFRAIIATSFIEMKWDDFEVLD